MRDSEKDAKLVKRLTITVVAYLSLCAATIYLFLFQAESLYANVDKPCCCNFLWVILAILSVVCFVLIFIFMRLYNDECEEEHRNRK